MTCTTVMTNTDATLGQARAHTIREAALSALARSIASIAPSSPVPLDRLARVLFQPSELQRELHSFLYPRKIIVSGCLEHRLLFLQLEERDWLAAHLGLRALSEIELPGVLRSEIKLRTPDRCVSACEISPQGLIRLTRPRIRLVSLCHRENFPLPRFPLSISDLARAIRRGFQGEVSMSDMQLGASIPELLAEIEAERPDIIGISATFGQHDLVEALADGLLEAESRSLLVFGGSLSALNAKRLLARYPNSLVARGPGEETICDIVEHWHGDRPLTAIRGIHWLSNGEVVSSKLPSNASSGGYLPELDLLERTLDSHGVMQLESSRGCTHACSFCPREHKGVWTGDEAGKMSFILDGVDEVFNRYPKIARKIFLVDEEFVGRDSEGEGLRRASAIADELWKRNFRWETSSRVDQVYRADRDRAWHAERLRFWTQLRERGLDRCLFGIESGVDSVLKRFNKRTTGRQNALALRLLSSCDIPIRCTYITFDHLMTLSELRESYEFQGRKDLLLRPQTSMSFEDLFEAVHDDSFAIASSHGVPFHSQITYMLVSMECLIGSPYLAKVQAAGLAREEAPAMGRRNADFLVPAIGLMSDCSQRWIDRNFSCDYLLKSLEKTTAGNERSALRKLRLLLKSYSYTLLGEFLALSDGPSSSGYCEPSLRPEDLIGLMDRHFERLVSEMDALSTSFSQSLQPHNWSLLARELEGWRSRKSWNLIND